MESTIVITVLIMACVITVVTLGEISKLTKENKELHRELGTLQELRKLDAQQIENVTIQMEEWKIRAYEEKKKRQEAEEMIEASVDREIKSKQLINPMGEHKHISYKQSIRRREFRDNPTALQREEIAVKAMLLETVSREVSKYIKEYDDAMHCETIYSLDVWV